jgi:hypothetical protein
MQRAFIMFLFIGFLSGCGFTQLPKLPPIIVRGQVMNVYPATKYLLDFYLDSMSVPYDYNSIGKVSECIEKTSIEKEDKDYLIEKLTRSDFANGLDADAVTKIHFFEKEFEKSRVFYSFTEAWVSPPAVFLPNRQLCAEGTIIKFLKNIPFIDSSYVTLKFPPNLFIDISLIDMNEKIFIMGENITKDLYPFSIKKIKTGIYRLEVVARNGPNWGLSQIVWKTSRWIEIRR